MYATQSDYMQGEVLEAKDRASVDDINSVLKLMSFLSVAGAALNYLNSM